MPDQRRAVPDARQQAFVRHVRDRVTAGADLVDLVAEFRLHPAALTDKLAAVGVVSLVPGAPQPNDTPAVRRANLTWLRLLTATVDDDQARLALLSRHCDQDPAARSWTTWLTGHGLIGRDKPRQFYGDRAWCAVQIARGRTRSQIANAAGSTSVNRVVQALQAHGLPVPASARRTGALPDQLDDPAWLAAAVADASRNAVAAELGVTFATLQRALERHGISTARRRPSGAKPRFPQLYDVDWVQSRAADGATRASVAAELGCSEASVVAACRRAGVSMPTGRVRGRPKRYPELSNATLLRAELERRVAALRDAGAHDVTVAVDELAAAIGCAPDTLRAACYEHQIRLPRAPHPSACPELSSRTWLAKHAHLTPQQAADALGCHVGQIYRAARQYAVEMADGRSVGRGNPNLSDPAVIAAVFEEVADHERPRQEAARLLGCAVDTLRSACRAAGLELPPSGRRGRRSFPQLHQPAWLAEQVEAGAGVAQLAERIGCSTAAVRRALQTHSIEGWRSRGSFPQLSDADTVRGWVDAGGVAEVARQAGCSYPTAWRAARTHASDLLDVDLDEDAIVAAFNEHGNQTQIARTMGLSPSTVHRILTVRGCLQVDPERVAHPKLADRDWLAEQVESGRTAAAIAAELEVSAGSVRTMMSRFGLRSHRRGRRPRYEQLADREWLRVKADSCTARQIADEVGCTTSAVYAALRRHHLDGLKDPSAASGPAGDDTAAPADDDSQEAA